MKKILILIVTILLFISCDTEENKGNYLSGKITYPSSSSGVRVRLYNAYDVNDTLTSIMSQYPNIGTKTDKNIIFDFNSQSAVETAFTDKKGNWEMTKLEVGNYNIVYDKNGSYDFEYDINVGNNGNDVKTKTLSKAVVWQDTTITGNVEISAFSNIFIQGTLTVDEYSTLTIGEGTNIVLSDSINNFDKGKIKVRDGGTLILNGTVDNYINVFGESKDNLEPQNIWSSISIGTNGNGKFRYVRFSNGNQAVFYLKSKVDVENCIFLGCSLGLGFEMNVGGNCNQNLFMGCKEGLNGTRIDSFDIRDNIFYENETGALLSGVGTFDFYNSYVSKSKVGIQVGDFANGVVRNNDIIRNETGIVIYGDSEENGGSKSRILNNTFKENKFLDINVSVIPYAKNPKPEIRYNNFFNNEIVNIKMYKWEVLDIEVYYNWWTGETDSLRIEDRIIDKDDYYGEGANALFMPVSENKIENAGIE